jgi:hypothetical protein
MVVVHDRTPDLRGVAIFAKACFGHPAQASSKNLTRPGSNLIFIVFPLFKMTCDNIIAGCWY